MKILTPFSALLLLCLTQSAAEKAPTKLGAPTIADGDDWTLPAWVTPQEDTGFFSEELDAAFNVGMRTVDVTWRQLNPAPGVFLTTATGSAQGMSFPSWDDQMASPDPYWMRIWASGVDWAPAWVMTDCGITTTWEDYDGQFHLPIWDSCVWGHLMTLYRKVFQDWNVRADPRFRLIYVPGAFTWCEFDFEIVELAIVDGLTFPVFNAWFQGAMAEMVAIFNGENGDPNDDYSHKLVYTGEDYPFGAFAGSADLLARDAVVAGLGVRNGITEAYNFHLNHTPAYGSTIASDGHIENHEAWPLLSNGRVIGSENECYTACGFNSTDVYYSVKMSNLKILQLRVNWLYVVPTESYMNEFPELWEWVRLSLGREPSDAPDAWVALREFQDLYWVDDNSHTWTGKPWVHNFERWLVQRDVGPDGVSRRGTDLRVEDLTEDNGIAYEGRLTDHATGQDYLYFFVDDAFLGGPAPPVFLKVTYLDSGSASWRVEYQNVGGATFTAAVTNGDSGAVKTATFTLEDAVFANEGGASSDFRIFNGGSQDVEIRFVRLIRREALSIFLDGFETGDSSRWSTVSP